MVGSTAHIIAGNENGHSKGDWHNSPSYPNHESNPDCIADMMHTEQGATFPNYLLSGLQAYCNWNDPTTPESESYTATVAAYFAPEYSGDFSYTMFKAEINAKRPVLLSVAADGYAPGTTQFGSMGDAIVGYGYRDSMFHVRVKTSSGYSNRTVGGMAVKDTFDPGTAFSSWKGWNDETVLPVIEGDVEWWPFILTTTESRGTSDWMVTEATFLQVNGWMHADANHDGKVNVGDLGIMGTNYGRTGMGWEQGDFNQDGIVDVGDLGMLGCRYGMTYSPYPSRTRSRFLLLG